MKNISIAMIMDVTGALTGDRLGDALAMIDNNRRGGSRNEGTARLITAVSKGDVLYWVPMPIEVEVVYDIHAIAIDSAYVKVTQTTYGSTGIPCWKGEVIADIDTERKDGLGYAISFLLGEGKVVEMKTFPSLINAKTAATLAEEVRS